MKQSTEHLVVLLLPLQYVVFPLALSAQLAPTRMDDAAAVFAGTPSARLFDLARVGSYSVPMGTGLDGAQAMQESVVATQHATQCSYESGDEQPRERVYE